MGTLFMASVNVIHVFLIGRVHRLASTGLRGLMAMQWMRIFHLLNSPPTRVAFSP